MSTDHMSIDYLCALEAENATMRDALSDLRYGAKMIAAIGVTGAFAKFASEVERIATNALNNNTTTEATNNA